MPELQSGIQTSLVACRDQNANYECVNGLGHCMKSPSTVRAALLPVRGECKWPNEMSSM
jgi:hypothetical protein